MVWFSQDVWPTAPELVNFFGYRMVSAAVSGGSSVAICVILVLDVATPGALSCVKELEPDFAGLKENDEE